jgi:hypothetical protein
MLDAFDILRKLPDGGIVWIEAAKDLETARERIELFSTLKPGDYVVFCQETQSIIALPWVSFPRYNVEPGAGSGKVKKTKTRRRPGAALKSGQVVADIVADITRTFRHRQ